MLDEFGAYRGLAVVVWVFRRRKIRGDFLCGDICYFVCQFSAWFFSPFVLSSHSVQMRTYIRNIGVRLSECAIAWATDSLLSTQPTNRPSDNTPSFYDRTRTLLCFFFLCILYVYRIFFSLSLCYCCVNLERYSRINFVSRLFFVVALSMELTRKRVYVHTFVSSFESNWI